MNKITCFAFDLDGTIYNGNSAVRGAVRAIATLIDRGYKIFYFTNNSARTRQQIVDKLGRLGFPAVKERTYCTSYALLRYLKEQALRTVYLIGSNDVKKELSRHGISVRASARVPAVVIGLDHDFHYSKIMIALEAIGKGAKLIVANMDASYPVENNKRLPGCGAMAGAVMSATGQRPDFLIGKPNTYMLHVLCKEHKLDPQEICIVGDSLATDIKMARYLKSPSILFDPRNAFPKFKGWRVKAHQDIISLIDKKEKGSP